MLFKTITLYMKANNKVPSTYFYIGILFKNVKHRTLIRKHVV